MSLLDLALTKEWLANRWLVGLNLTDPATGLPYPDAHYQQAILQARDMLAYEFDLALEPTSDVQPVDVTQWSESTDFLMTMPKRPIISVEKISFWAGNNEVWTVPPEWIIRPSDKFGQLQLKPDGITHGAYTTRFPNTFQGNHAYKASQIRVAYTAGYPETDVGQSYGRRNSDRVIGVGTAFKTTVKLNDFIGYDGAEARVVARIVSDTELIVDRPWDYANGAAGDPPDTLTTLTVRMPAIFGEFIGALAAGSILTTAGDLVIGAGIASMSRSIDGLSQSINTTSSAENSAYSARIKSLQEVVKDVRVRVKRLFRPILGFVI